jgi:predicted nuclease of predicted toxin-antitoxin system
MGAAEDPAVMTLAANEDRILISADTDFGTLLSLRQEIKPSVILLRQTSRRRPEQQLHLLLANLPNLADDLANGCIAVFDENRIRVRALPIGGKAG